MEKSYNEILSDLTSKFHRIDPLMLQILKLRHDLLALERQAFESPSLMRVDSFFEYYDFLDWVPLENCVCGYDSTRATIPPLKRTLSSDSLSSPETQ